MPYRILSHTADLKIRFSAGSIRTLYREAVRVLMGVMIGKAAVESQKPACRQGRSKVERIVTKRIIKISSPDAEALFIDFLNEIITLCVMHKVRYDKLVIRTLNNKRFEGEVCGVEAGGLKKEIKAATYHDVMIKRSKGQVSVDVVFDI